MILVDTSAWIDALGPRPGAITQRLRAHLDRGEPCALTPVILLEVLQGARSDREFDRLHAYLTAQPMLHPLDAVGTHARAAQLYRRCRAAAVTPRSSIDCLIAQLAIEHNAALLHDDRDFDQIARVVPELMMA
ncbi:MAG: PIN domain-containing protein [Phycisphaeraceae bacterium]